MWDRWRRRRREGGSGNALAAECEAFLAGHYLDLLCSNGRLAIPAWAYVNCVAHASRAELEEMANREASPSDAMALVSYMASEVIGAANRLGVEVSILQGSVLIPFELKLCGIPPSSAPSRVTELAAQLHYALSNQSPS